MTWVLVTNHNTWLSTSFDAINYNRDYVNNHVVGNMKIRLLFLLWMSLILLHYYYFHFFNFVLYTLR